MHVLAEKRNELTEKRALNLKTIQTGKPETVTGISE